MKPSQTEGAKSLEALGRFFNGNEIAENAIADLEKAPATNQTTVTCSVDSG